MLEIKKCAKCGKANDPMRKYCRACGASLIVLDEEPKAEPEPIEELEGLLSSEPEAETPSPAEDESLVRPSDLASSPEDAPLVRPSDVASEQADMGTTEEVVETPKPEEVVIEPEEEPSEPMDTEKGREVVQDILEKVKAAEARAKEAELEPPPEPLEDDEPLVYDEPEVEPEVEEPTVAPEPEEEIVDSEEPVEPAAIAEVAAEPIVTKEEPAKDEKIRKFESDISAYNIELQQLQSEMDALRVRLDEETERYSTAAAVKRTRVESVKRDLRLAKQEFSDANKEHKNAENRRKKELSNAEKRIRGVEKRIKKAEDSKRKRLENLEKERRKREEEARKS